MKRFCPVCQNSNISKKLTFNGYNLQRCGACTLEFLINENSSKNEPHIYNEGYFNGELAGAKGYSDYSQLQNQLRKEASKKISYIRQFTSEKELLDLGAGTGVFVREAQKNGFRISGNDISSYAVNHLKKIKIKTFAGSIEKKILPKQQFEIITAWDVIEHLYNPLRALRNINFALKPGGFLFLTTPDTNSFDAQILGKNWYGYKKIPEHVSFFNKKSMTKLLEESGFKLINIKPWGFHRSLGFIVDKLQTYSSAFSLVNKLLEVSKLSEISFFIPLTDSLIVARKPQ